MWILAVFKVEEIGQKGQNPGLINKFHGNEVVSFLFFFCFLILLESIGAMGLGTNINFSDDAYPTTLLGKQLEGMRRIR